MRLLSFNITGEYRSLKDFTCDFRGHPIDIQHMEPICLVGLNGSGKSNLIEALSEVFCYLDLYSLDYVPPTQLKRVCPPPFSIEYLLNISSSKKSTHMKVGLSDKNKITFYRKVDDDFEPIERADDWRKYLPSRLVGYSSGHNETVSMPYLRNQSLYSIEVASQAKAKGEKKKKVIQHTSSIYMDYDSNASILIANYLFLKNNELSIFDEFLRISGVSSFSISLNLKPRNSVVVLTEELEGTIRKLEACSIHAEKTGAHQQLLSFVVNSASKKAFKKYFGDAKSFYLAIYKLTLLNALSLTKREREFYLRSDLKKGLLERAPTISKKDKVFSINDLRLVIARPEKEVDYSGISDGEHQFIHIFGTLMLFSEENCLYLLDEPESHFNPLWRAEFIKIMNGIDSTRYQDFVVSTHSPFLVSAAHSDNVIKFSRIDGIIHLESLEFQSYGSSFEYLLAKLFDLRTPISAQALDELKQVVKSDDINDLKLAISRFGESLEKRYLYQRLAELESEGK